MAVKKIPPLGTTGFGVVFFLIPNRGFLGTRLGFAFQKPSKNKK